MFLLRVAAVVALIPALVIIDWAVYAYVGTLPGHIVAGLSVVAAIAGLWWLARFDEDDADPLWAERRRR